MIAMEKAMWFAMGTLISNGGSYPSFTKIIGNAWNQLRNMESPKSISQLRSHLHPTATIEDISQPSPEPARPDQSSELATLRAQFEAFQKAQEAAKLLYMAEKASEAERNKQLADDLSKRLERQAAELELAKAKTIELAEENKAAVQASQKAFLKRLRSGLSEKSARKRLRSMSPADHTPGQRTESSSPLSRQSPLRRMTPPPSQNSSEPMELDTEVDDLINMLLDDEDSESTTLSTSSSIIPSSEGAYASGPHIQEPHIESISSDDPPRPFRLSK